MAAAWSVSMYVCYTWMMTHVYVRYKASRKQEENGLEQHVGVFRLISACDWVLLMCIESVPTAEHDGNSAHLSILDDCY